MQALKTNSFDLQEQEVQELINAIKKAYQEENKETFLGAANKIAEIALSDDLDDAVFNKNVYEMLKQLPEVTALALIQVLIQINENGRSVNDILGNSDDIFIMLKNISKELEKDPEVIKVKTGTAFYH